MIKDIFLFSFFSPKEILPLEMQFIAAALPPTN